MSHDAFATGSEIKKPGAGKPVTDPNLVIAPESRDHDSLAGLRDSTSFPLRIIYGEESDLDGSWQHLPQEISEPSGLWRKYSAGKCFFEISTGAFSVREHGRKSNEDYAVIRDGYAPQTILRPTPESPLTLSITTELTARVIDASEQACAKTFSSKRLRFAAINLDGSQITATDLAGKTIIPRTVVSAEATNIYLSWDAEANALRLTDRHGLAAGVQTGVLKFEARELGTFYLQLKPQWTITRFHRTAKLP